ncbi:MAG: hypothetical protein ACK5QJ_18830, partial [Microcystis sp.]|uniref:hypothetical protein n=1 Tax=Microcystis sp. TaxID=1127 RepID=UPI003919A2C3
PYGFWGGFLGVFWWGLGARDAPLRVLGGVGFLGFFGGGWAHAPLRVLGGLGFLGVSGKIRRCELRSLMMGIDKRFC